MADIFGYITPDELSSTNDPVEVLLSAATLTALNALTSYDPTSLDSWGRSKVKKTRQTPRTITNSMSGKPVNVIACKLLGQ